MAEDDALTPRDDVAVTLRELAWTIHRHAPDRAGVGPIPTTEIALLKQIIDTPGTTVGELAQTLGLRQPNVSAAVRTLVERGLVERTQSTTDRRISHVVATESGVAEHAAISAAWAGPVNDAIAALDPDLRQTLAGAEPALLAVLRSLRSGDEHPSDAAAPSAGAA